MQRLNDIWEGLQSFLVASVVLTLLKYITQEQENRQAQDNALRIG